MLINPLIGFSTLGSVFFGAPDDLGTTNSCPFVPATCTNSTPIENSCCFESPGGILLLTQFWDYYPPIGGNETFTLHGLWPNRCSADNTYDQFCDPSLEVHNPKEILSSFDPALLSDLEEYWKNFNGHDESLWEHEFNKHGTCVNTIKPNCYSSYKPHQNVYDYFRVTVELYKKLDTFQFLAAEGIVPSNDKTYTKSEIQSALDKNFGGKKVYFHCNKYNGLQEVWYYHHLQGPLTGEQFVPIDASQSSRCPETGIKFFPKGSLGHIPPPPKHPSDLPTGYLKIGNGCAISSGKFFTKGTCATFRVKKAEFGGYNLLSSKGTCFVEDNALKCNRSKNTKNQFNVKDGKVGYNNVFKWCVDGTNDQKDIVLSDGTCQEFELQFEEF
ncbi:ribonuclease T2-like [Yamadazyma tenuis]|uniref:Ribonuclease T2-like n=1 Tax=Candida tenuis (strain ATCC 10573 / BCRC 21748 / CBS 615 / JCM 9827 / NBRC 10315 / NRRL Y-1498 / VKM Y-70) TaxID=590646 RepID=G3BD46_CANTC|nr:ribonuclease T2-like 1-A [Yamadazyma tenuis ATCC 10573]XP_006690519.1 uncharacterized protein CANTEDRAFT_116963 [Yamadazyma tenuis ATCC 10573]EGV61304.1 ribonuclease T2-like 1-A [Yamadazyma tenuis ATCC 10573]EGV61305.1 hypothetical protein CANTEDRAFT_116963 [Yamadazyma tenuis ATCC 10573]WEJ93815.1 ribonuclease T2-like [Yamadazyma tenuis]